TAESCAALGVSVGGASRDASDPGIVGAGRTPATVVLFGERFFVDVMRRLDDGESPGIALDRFLLDRGLSAPIPAWAGAVEYRAPRAAPVALLVVRAFVP